MIAHLVMWACCNSHRGHVFKQTRLASARSVCNLAVDSTVDTHAERKHITYIELTDNGIGSEHVIWRPVSMIEVCKQNHSLTSLVTVSPACMHTCDLKDPTY